MLYCIMVDSLRQGLQWCVGWGGGGVNILWYNILNPSHPFKLYFYVSMKLFRCFYLGKLENCMMVESLK